VAAFQVEIFGHRYSLRTESDEEHVHRVVELVDARMREVASGSASLSPLQVAVLAALGLASEYLQEEMATGGFVSRMEDRLDFVASGSASATQRSDVHSASQGEYAFPCCVRDPTEAVEPT
jgi:cell division protein ZapA (FtsZ GTPase activity inhibitor)